MLPVPLLSGIPVLMHDLWLFDSVLLFLPVPRPRSRRPPNRSLSLSNGLTLHTWLSAGTSSEVLVGHMHDDQVNKQPGLGGEGLRVMVKGQNSREIPELNAGPLVLLWGGYFRNLLWCVAHLTNSSTGDTGLLLHTLLFCHYLAGSCAGDSFFLT